MEEGDLFRTQKVCISSMKYPIYEGDEILRELKTRPYLNSFQAKLYYVPQFEEDRGTKNCLFHVLTPSIGHSDRFMCSPVSESMQHVIEKTCVEDEAYIFTIFNMHHQQYTNVGVLALNFDIKERKLVVPWRQDQLYPGYPIYGAEEKYKEDGSPDV